MQRLSKVSYTSYYYRTQKRSMECVGTKDTICQPIRPPSRGSTWDQMVQGLSTRLRSQRAIYLQQPNDQPSDPTAITACHLIYDRALCQQMATFSEAQGCQLGQTFAPPPVQTSVLWLWFYSWSLWFRHEPPWVSAEALVWIHFIIYNLHWGCTIAKPLLVSVCPCHPWLSQEMHRLSHYFLKVHLMLHVC